MTPLSIDREQLVSCLRAGLFLDVLSLPEGTDEDEIRRQVRRRIARLQGDFAADQDVLDDLKLLQDWLPHRLREYEEWVQPCLDYVFAYLGGIHARDEVGPAVQEGRFAFKDFQKRFVKPVRALPETAALLAMAAVDACTDTSVLAIRFAQVIADQRDYMYADGEGCCGPAELKQARVDALELVDYCPDELECHRQLGRALLEFGEFANALVCFQRERGHTPRGGWVRHSITWCQLKQGFLEAALTNAEATLALLPRRPDVHHDYAAVLLQCNRGEDALAVTRGAMRRFSRPGLPLRYLHALLLSRSGESEQATAAWLDYIRYARGRSGHSKAVDRALAALGALGCRVSAEIYPLRTIAGAVVESLVPDLSEELLASRLVPDAIINVLAPFRSGISKDLLRAVGVGHGAFGQARLRDVCQAEEAKAISDDGDTSQAQHRLQVIYAEISELREKCRHAEGARNNWGKVNSQLLQADLTARQIEAALIESNNSSSRGWSWRLTGRAAAHVRRIRLTVTQLVQELEVVPDCQPAPRFSNNDAGDLVLIGRDLPAWLKLVRYKIQSGLNLCAQEKEWLQTASMETRQRLELLDAKRTEAADAFNSVVATQKQRRVKRIASLKTLEQETPASVSFAPSVVWPLLPFRALSVVSGKRKSWSGAGRSTGPKTVHLRPLRVADLQRIGQRRSVKRGCWPPAQTGYSWRVGIAPDKSNCGLLPRYHACGALWRNLRFIRSPSERGASLQVTTTA
jgi:tetratricopeptide (TPR) repeat protein